MSEHGPTGDDPFKGVPFFGDLARMLQSQGPVSWDMARQFAVAVASEGIHEVNVDPLDRIALGELVRVAELRVADATGLSVSTTGRIVSVVPVTRTTWAQRAVEAYKPLFERLAGAIGPDAAGAPVPAEPGDDDPAAALFGGLMQMLSPMMLGMAAGSMVGHLARRAFGQYDLPIPRPASDELLVVPANLEEFADGWSLPREDLRLWVSLHELTHHAVLGVPHVQRTLGDLIGRFVSGFRPDPHALEGRLESIDFTDPSALAGFQQAFADPEVLLGAMRSPEQAALQPRLDALIAVIVGYVDHIMDAVGTTLIGSYRMMTEAVRRRRVEASDADRFVERLLGLTLSQEQVDRGSAFVAGVLERAGDTGLQRLWASERELPTPAEVEAPGLWLARIDLPE